MIHSIFPFFPPQKYDHTHVNDLNEVWSARNYNNAVADADNPRCDLNGDGFINVNDLNIVWSSTNYNKREVVVL